MSLPNAATADRVLVLASFRNAGAGERQARTDNPVIYWAMRYRLRSPDVSGGLEEVTEVEVDRLLADVVDR